MDKKVNALINKYTNDELLLDKLVVSSFSRCQNLDVHKGYLVQYVAEEKDGLEQDITLLSRECTLEDVISIFELVIPQVEKPSMEQYIRPNTSETILSVRYFHLWGSH